MMVHHTITQYRALTPLFFAYAYIARRLGWNAVSALALIDTEPVTTDEAAAGEAARREDGFAMAFAAKIVGVEKDEGMLAPLFAREGCGDCGYFEKIGGLLG
jgi:hypothetical protein